LTTMALHLLLKIFLNFFFPHSFLMKVTIKDKERFNLFILYLMKHFQLHKYQLGIDDVSYHFIFIHTSIQMQFVTNIKPNFLVSTLKWETSSTSQSNKTPIFHLKYE
jgi:hypothetical protein